MRTREVITQWHRLRDGDKFLRYANQGVIKMLVVERESPDIPTKKGAMGYAVIDRDGATEAEVLLVRIYDAESNHPHPWVAPFQNGAWHTMRDDHISEFKEMHLMNRVLPGDIRDAIREGINDSGTDRKGALITAVEARIHALYTYE